MPAFHVSLSFSQPPLWGWVEQLWWEGASVFDALAAGQALARARYAILGAGVSLYRVRVAVPHTPRAGLSAPVTGRTLANLAMPAVQVLEVRLLGTGSPPHRRSYVLRGLPIGSASIVGGQLQIAPAIAPALQRWLSLLLAGGWRLAATQPLGSPVPVAGLALVNLVDHDAYGAPVDAAVIDPVNTLVYCQCAAPTQTQATQVRVYGCRMSPPGRRIDRTVNGTHDIAANDGQGVYWQGTFAGGSFLGGGQAQFYADILVPIQSAEPIGLVARKCGPAKAAPAETAPPETGLSLVGTSGPSGQARPEVPSPPVVEERDFNDALDIAQEVFEGYIRLNPTQTQKIGLAQVVGTERATYVLFLAGVDTGTRLDTLLQWSDALQAAIGLPDSYTSEVRRLVREHTPDGCDLIICGHSLGGIAGQQLFGRLSDLGTRRPILYLGFGCPSVTFSALRAFTIGGDLIEEGLTDVIGKPPPTRIFAVRGDPVVWLTPAGNWFWFRYLLAIGSAGVTEFVIFLANQIAPFNTTYIQEPPGVFPNPFLLHMSYPDCLSLVQYSWDGILDPDGKQPTLKTGPVTRYPWPPNP